jgi:hypothetical protein
VNRSARLSAEATCSKMTLPEMYKFPDIMVANVDMFDFAMIFSVFRQRDSPTIISFD